MSNCWQRRHRVFPRSRRAPCPIHRRQRLPSSQSHAPGNAARVRACSGSGCRSHRSGESPCDTSVGPCAPRPRAGTNQTPGISDFAAIIMLLGMTTRRSSAPTETPGKRLPERPREILADDGDVPVVQLPDFGSVRSVGRHPPNSCGDFPQRFLNPVAGSASHGLTTAIPPSPTNKNVIIFRPAVDATGSHGHSAAVRGPWHMPTGIAFRDFLARSARRCNDTGLERTPHEPEKAKLIPSSRDSNRWLKEVHPKGGRVDPELSLDSRRRLGLLWSR